MIPNGINILNVTPKVVPNVDRSNITGQCNLSFIFFKVKTNQILEIGEKTDNIYFPSLN